MRKFTFFCLVLIASTANAQPDTLFIPKGHTVIPHAVIYDPVEPAEQYRMTGRFAHDPERVAVEIDYKRGKPSGVYRAYFPDGRPLIFAVYGWGSLHGDWTEYNEAGQIAIKGRYRQGLRDGAWHFRDLRIAGKYSKGLKDGKWKTFNGKRTTSRSRYRNGELISGQPVEVP